MSDKLLEMLAAAEAKGGLARKEALKNLWMIAKSIVPSRIHIDYGKDKGGACKIRYGPNNYKVLDVNTEGTMYTYYESHWKKRLPKEDRENLITELQSLPEIKCVLEGSNQYMIVDGEIEKQTPEAMSDLLLLLIRHLEKRFYPEELRLA